MPDSNPGPLSQKSGALPMGHHISPKSHHTFILFILLFFVHLFLSLPLEPKLKLFESGLFRKINLSSLAPSLPFPFPFSLSFPLILLKRLSLSVYISISLPDLRSHSLICPPYLENCRHSEGAGRQADRSRSLPPRSCRRRSSRSCRGRGRRTWPGPPPPAASHSLATATAPLAMGITTTTTCGNSNSISGYGNNNNSHL